MPMSAYPVGAYEQRTRPGFRPKAVRPDLPPHSGRDHRKVPLRPRHAASLWVAVLLVALIP